MTGRVNSIAFDPSDSWGATVFAGAATGGLWVTTDAGADWRPLSDADSNWSFLQISSVAISPDGTRVYVGTGDFPSGTGYDCKILIGTVTGGGRVAAASTASDIHWTPVYPAKDSSYDGSSNSNAFSKIVVDPVSPGIVMATTGRAYGTHPDGTGQPGYGYIYRSTNSGATWSIVNQADTTPCPAAVWCDLKLGTAQDYHQYYAVGYDYSGKRYFAVSYDDGATWTITNPPAWTSAPDSNGVIDTSLISVAPSANTAGVVYAAVGARYVQSGSTRATTSAVYRSINNGASWGPVTTGFPTNTVDGHYSWDQAPYNLCMAAGQNGTADSLYTGLYDILQSPDGGSSWGASSQAYSAGVYSGTFSPIGPNNLSVPTYPYNPPSPGTPPVDQIHTDQHAFAFFPSGGAPEQDFSRCLVGNDGGVFQGQLGTFPATWSSYNGNTHGGVDASLGTMMVHSLACDPNNPDIILAGLQDNGNAWADGTTRTDGTKNWEIVTDSDGGNCAFTRDSSGNPVRFNSTQFLQLLPNTVYTGTIYRNEVDITPIDDSSRRGFQVDGVPDNMDEMPPLVLDPNDSNLLYVGTQYLWVRDNSTGHWTSHLGGDFANSAGNITSIAIAPGHSSTIYVGTELGHVFKSIDQGATWTGIANSPAPTVTSIVVDAGNPNSVVVGLSGSGDHVYHCKDTTQSTCTWTDLDGGKLPPVSLNCIAADPFYSGCYYVGTDEGVCYGVPDGSGGMTWYEANHSMGLPNVQVNALQALQTSGYVMAATYGRGIWRLPTSPPPATPYFCSTPVASGSTMHVVVSGIMDNGSAFFDTPPSPPGAPEPNHIHATVNIPGVTASITGYDSSHVEMDVTVPSTVGTNASGTITIANPNGMSVTSPNPIFYVEDAGAVDVSADTQKHSLVLWKKTDGSGMMQIEQVDDTGTLSTIVHDYLPGGRQPTAMACGQDGNIRVLWVRPDGAGDITVYSWSTGPGAYVRAYVYYTQNSSTQIPVDVAVDSSNQTRVLMVDYTTNQCSIWAYVDSYQNSYPNPSHQTPYPISAGWRPKRIGGGTDGKIRLLSQYSDGSGGVTGIDANADTIPYEYPCESNGVWPCVDVAPGADGYDRLLLTTASGYDRSIMGRGMNTSTGLIQFSTTNGPYSEYNPAYIDSSLGTNTDTYTRILSPYPNGAALLCLEDPNGNMAGFSGGYLGIAALTTWP